MPFTTLRNFIEEAISGEHSAEEVKQILDNIEQGVGLMEHEKQTAEALEQLPQVDEEDPVYQRGVGEATRQFVLQFYPLLQRMESAGHGKMPVCPWCRAGGRDDSARQLHALEGCELQRNLEGMRPIWKRIEAEQEARGRAAETVAAEQLTTPVAEALKQ